MQKNSLMRLLVMVSVFTVLFTLSAGVTAAFLKKDLNPKKNVITMGAVEIELEESKWNTESVPILTPGKETEKNPQIRNIGKNDAYVFLEVGIPIRNVICVNSESNRKEMTKKEPVFQLKEISEQWKQLSMIEKEDCIIYVYGYKNVLQPGQQTDPLFKRISILPYLEGTLDEKETYHVSVCAQAIQNELETNKLEEVYHEFLMQMDIDSKER